MEEYGRGGEVTDDNIIQRMSFACWITKATHTLIHSLRICNTYCFSVAKTVSGTRLNVTFIRTVPLLF
jgi:hypothetical protein